MKVAKILGDEAIALYSVEANPSNEVTFHSHCYTPDRGRNDNGSVSILDKNISLQTLGCGRNIMFTLAVSQVQCLNQIIRQ